MDGRKRQKLSPIIIGSSSAEKEEKKNAVFEEEDKSQFTQTKAAS